MTVAPSERRLLAAIVVAAALVRLVGLRFWLHPDEPVILRAVERIGSDGLNPGFFNYPSLFLYQEALLGGLVALFGGEPGSLVYLGRALVALYSVVGVVLLWALGRRLAGPEVGLGAGALMALTGAIVLWSHYALTDIPMLVLSIGCALVAVRGYQRRSELDLMAATVIGGLAVSTKYNAAPVLVVPFLLTIVLARGPDRRRRLVLAAVLPVIAVAAFVVGTPYSVLDADRFGEELREELQLQTEGRPGWHFPEAQAPTWTQRGLVLNARQLVMDAGVPMVALGMLGIALLGTGRRPARASGSPAPSDVDRVALAACLAWPTLYYLQMASSVLSSRNYILSLYPMLLICGAAGAVGAGRWLAERTRVSAVAATVGALVLASIVPALLTVRSLAALTATDSRHALATWAEANLVAGDVVAYELFTGPGRLGAAETHYEAVLAQQPLRAWCHRGYALLVVSSINRSLYLQRTDPAYDRYRRWYRQLERRAELVAEFPGHEVEFVDPTIGVYRLDCDAIDR